MVGLGGLFHAGGEAAYYDGRSGDDGSARVGDAAASLGAEAAEIVPLDFLLAANPTNAKNLANTPTVTPAAPLSELLGEAPAPSFRDTTSQFGHAYVYSVRSVVRYGSTPNESAESDESNLLALAPKDIFPPAAPQGLVAVPVPATSNTPAGIELSWAISAESDLAGYNIYRSDQDSKSPRRLNQSTLLTPAYRDITVFPGRLYTYTVTAVDRAGNESPASEPVTAGISAAA